MQYRKLIAHGQSSLTIALPYRWINRYKLAKGDTVSINEDEQGLHISARPSEIKKNIAVDLTGYDWPSTLTALTTIYRRGYDEVSIKYETPKEYQNISTAVRTLLGYAIMENRNNKCLIKSLPSELEQDFQTLFRRVFFILLQELEDLKELLSSPEALKTFYQRDADLNTIVNLALRMISKGYVQDRFEELHMFHSLLLLEECGDDVTRFTLEIRNCKDAIKLKEEIIAVIKMVRMLHDAYFQNKQTINDFYKQYYLYWPEERKTSPPVYEILANTSKNKPLFYLRSIVEKVVHLAEILLVPHVE